VGTAFIGEGEPNGDDPRLIHRTGVDARLAMDSWIVSGAAHFNDWGPYDYHRDFNLTYPLQAGRRSRLHARHAPLVVHESADDHRRPGHLPLRSDTHSNRYLPIRAVPRRATSGSSAST
jgi:hypothetical protein